MKKFEIDLPDDVVSFVEEAVGGALDSAKASYYIRRLIADDMARRDRLLRELQKGLDSGLSELTFDEIIAQAKERSRAA